MMASLRALPPLIRALIVTHAAVFLLQWLLVRVPAGDFLYQAAALVPANALGRFWLWQLLTYVFFHNLSFFGGFIFLINMSILWFMGGAIEQRWGTWPFLRYLAVAVAAGGLVTAGILHGSQAPVVNPAPMVYAVLIAFAFMNPDAPIRYFFIPVGIWHLIIFLALMEFLSGYWAGNSPAQSLGNLTAMGAAYLFVKSGGWRWAITGLPGRLTEKVRERSARKKAVQFHELGQEVDRILDKVLKQGVDSLTPEEQDLMQRYSKMKKS